MLRSLVGNLEAAETKKTLGFHAANTLTPEASQKLIREKVAAAFARHSEFRPYGVTSPVTVDISFKSYTAAETLAYLRMFERADAHSVRFTARDMTEASDIVGFITHYSVEQQP